MDKGNFIDMAPEYYAVAIASYFKSNWAYPASKQDILSYYTTTDDMDTDSYCYLHHSVLFEKGIEIVRERGLITVIPDVFGPPIYVRTEKFDERLNELKNKEGVFYKYGLFDNGERWVRSALQKLNDTYLDLDIQKSDFEKPDQEWEPLPIDRDDPNVQKVIESLDETIEQVRADNGYAATVPGERDYVLESLSSVRKILKEASTTTMPYIKKYALEPLGTLMWRFKNAALALAAEATYGAFLQWLKSAGVKMIEYAVKTISGG